jgi:hypothetical protein
LLPSLIAASVTAASVGSAAQCPSDVDGDRIVGVDDVLHLVSAWGPCDPGDPCPADVIPDGRVDLSDLQRVLADWGACPSDGAGGLDDPAGRGDPGPTMETAFDLGVLGPGSLDVTGGLGPGDTDWYRFECAAALAVTISTGPWAAGATLDFVYDRSGNGVFDPVDLMRSITAAPGEAISLPIDLTAHPWWIRLRGATESQAYTLSFDASALPEFEAGDPGETLAGAGDLGVLGDEVVLARDLYSPADAGDVYRFTIDSARLVTVTMGERTDLGSFRILVVLDGNDVQQVGFGGSAGTAAATVERELTPGDYWIRILSSGTVFSRYTIRVKSEVIEGLGDADAGDSIVDAAEFGPVGDFGTARRGIVSPYDPIDFFRIEVPAASELVARVEPQSDDIEIRGWAAAPSGPPGAAQQLFQSVAVAGNVREVEFAVSAGTWWISVEQRGPGDATSYSLAIGSRFLDVDPGRDPGGSVATAADLGPLDGREVQVSELVGAWDPVDAYRFSIATPSEILIKVSPANTLDYIIYADRNGNGFWDAEDETMEEDDSAISRVDLARGEYWLVVRSMGGAFYTAALSPTVIGSTLPQDPGGDPDHALPVEAPSGEQVVFRDLYGVLDLEDWYRLDVEQAGTIELWLRGRVDGAQLALFHDVNGDGWAAPDELVRSRADSGDTDFLLSDEVVPGRHYIRVRGSTPNDGSRYRLEVTTP